MRRMDCQRARRKKGDQGGGVCTSVHEKSPEAEEQWRRGWGGGGEKGQLGEIFGERTNDLSLSAFCREEEESRQEGTQVWGLGSW